MITDKQIILALGIGFAFGILPALVYMAYINRMLNEFIKVVRNPPFANIDDENEENNIYRYPDPDYWKRGEKPYGD